MYYLPGSYELTEPEQKLFGMSKVDVHYDAYYSNAIVLNQPSNGLLAGSRLVSRTNQHFKKDLDESISNRRFTYSITDDHNAWQMVRLVESRISSEQTDLEQRIGTLAYLGANLPQLQSAEPAVQEQYVHSLERFLLRDKRALSDDKKMAAAEIEYALDKMVTRGHVIPSTTRSHVLHAAGHYAERNFKLFRQQRTNEERRARLKQEFRADQYVKNQMRAIALGKSAIQENPEDFLELARQRRTKPGVLSVNNAWYHRHEENSWASYLQAQDAWEELSGLMMWPMNNLAGERVKGLERLGKEVVFGHYVLMLTSLEDVVDLSKVGGEYTWLGNAIQAQLFRTEELMINGQFSEMHKAAETLRKLVPYRVLLPTGKDPSFQPPPEWYGGLPPKPRPKLRGDDEDVFAGLG